MINFFYIKSICSKKEINYLKFIFFLMIINSLLEVLSIGMLLPLFSLVFSGTDNSLITKKILEFFSSSGLNISIEIFLFIVILTFFLKYSFTIFYTKYVTSFIVNLRASISSTIFKDYLYKSLNYHSKNSSATLVRNIDKEVGIFINNYLSPVLSYILAILTILFIFLLLLVVNFKITLILIIFFTLIYYVIILLFSKKLKEIGEKRQHHDKFSLKYIYQAIRTIIEVKLLELEKFYRDSFFYHVNMIAKVSVSRSVIGVLPKIIFEFSLLIIICYLIYIYNLRNYPIDDLMAQLLVYATAGFRILPALNLITSSNQKIKFGQPAAKLLSDTYLNFDERSYSKDKKYENLEINFEKEILIKNIKFSYENDNKIFDNFDIKLNKYQTIGIKGKNGSGKTTLVKIISGLIKTEGLIMLIDGTKIDINSSAWKKLIGYIPQEVNLIEGSIIENIYLGDDKKNFDKKKVTDLIKDVNLEKFINRLPNGLSTSISELGSNISGGEKQKIGICRALLRDPEILIFDESTSALDKESEAQLIEVLTKKFKNKTKIIISHREAAFKYCDEIIDLDLLKV